MENVGPVNIKFDLNDVVLLREKCKLLLNRKCSDHLCQLGLVQTANLNLFFGISRLILESLDSKICKSPNNGSPFLVLPRWKAASPACVVTTAHADKFMMSGHKSDLITCK